MITDAARSFRYPATKGTIRTASVTDFFQATGIFIEKPRPKQLKKIESAFKKLGNELIAVEL